LPITSILQGQPSSSGKVKYILVTPSPLLDGDSVKYEI